MYNTWEMLVVDGTVSLYDECGFVYEVGKECDTGTAKPSRVTKRELDSLNREVRDGVTPPRLVLSARRTWTVPLIERQFCKR